MDSVVRKFTMLYISKTKTTNAGVEPRVLLISIKGTSRKEPVPWHGKFAFETVILRSESQ